METINNGMCRCCASEGTFKDVATRYQWMGEEEVYGEMLRECFDITLAASDDGQEAGICEVCITQLRNAANFKKQVQRTEEQFKRRLDDLPFKSNIVKVEASPLEEAVGVSDDDDKYSDEMSLSEYQEIAIKTESSDDTKAKKRSAKATTSRAKQPKLEAETSSKRNRSETQLGIVKRSMSEFLKILRPKAIKRERRIEWTVSIKKPSSRKTIPREIDKHLHNIREILLYTNATPIRCHDGQGYACCFCCENSFPDPTDLKSHTLLKHTDSEKNLFMENFPMASYVVKLDVTALQCLLCQNSIEGLEQLMNHLIQEHNKKLHLDINNHIIPFSFKNEAFVCVVCSKIFKSFKIIQEHMNVHYGSYLCQICSAPFVNKRTMMSHLRRHKQGDFDCQTCGKVFDTRSKRDIHVRYVHEGIQKRNKCRICSEKFTSHKKKLDHMVEIHGAEPLVFKCLACEKSFASRDRLTKHTKKDHLMERRHECEHCEKKFFTSKDLKNHMLKHTGIREFQCDVCLKCYGRKHTLREHMRIHADDRRFKCERCEQAFVQKCSWKSHMRSKHGEVEN
ncbi:gastrula zinc finger protein XlCGF26.1-like isoform X2 [Ostrinia furnacalis]|uniref:gastrula zinc finger protein XlCGF26.1-like isoform X2 n=1 Tax=Ostrinia furnacalis TaxID=93504 RepID=UPI0010386D31|nr:gastrula zinc finger protein XlCGF26.1-like isoform X2 [Ostrinia furnacalis]